MSRRSARRSATARSPSLPATPDLAVIATPPATVPGLIAELGARGCRAAVVVTAGFGEGDRSRAASSAPGDARRGAAASAAHRRARTASASSRPAAASTRASPTSTPHAGNLAFVTQSGALATAVLDWAAARGIGFSHVVSLGDMADVDFGDLLDYLALGPRDARRSCSTSRASPTRASSCRRRASRRAPSRCIVIKAGRQRGGRQGGRSRTPARSPAPTLVYDAAFRRAGMLRVYRAARAVRGGRDALRAASTRRRPPRHPDQRRRRRRARRPTRWRTSGGRLAALSPETLARARRGAAADLVARPIRSTSSATPPASATRGALAVAARRPRARRHPASSTARPRSPTASRPPRRWSSACRRPIGACRCSPAGSARPAAARGAARSSRPSGSRPTRRRTRRCARSCTWSHYRRNQELLLETPPAGPRQSRARPRRGPRRDRQGARRRAAAC